jgi:hypothetical protein
MLQRAPGRRGAGRSLHGRGSHADLPERVEARDRTVIQFDCRAPKRRYWLVLEPGDVSVCREAPGFDADVLVEADAAQLYDLYFGRTTLLDAAIAVRGAARREVDSWFAWSTYAPAVRV